MSSLLLNVNIETPDKYIYIVDKVKTSQKHHESKHSFQSLIDELLVFKINNREATLGDITVYAKGVLAGRSAKKSVMEARKELNR